MPILKLLHAIHQLNTEHQSFHTDKFPPSASFNQEIAAIATKVHREKAVDLTRIGEFHNQFIFLIDGFVKGKLL